MEQPCRNTRSNAGLEQKIPPKTWATHTAITIPLPQREITTAAKHHIHTPIHWSYDYNAKYGFPYICSSLHSLNTYSSKHHNTVDHAVSIVHATIGTTTTWIYVITNQPTDRPTDQSTARQHCRGHVIYATLAAYSSSVPLYISERSPLQIFMRFLRSLHHAAVANNAGQQDNGRFIHCLFTLWMHGGEDVTSTQQLCSAAHIMHHHAVSLSNRIMPYWSSAFVTRHSATADDAEMPPSQIIPERATRIVPGWRRNRSVLFAAVAYIYGHTSRINVRPSGCHSIHSIL